METKDIKIEMFKEAFDNSVLGLALVSTTGKWIYVNKAIPQILGFSEQELLTKDFKDITYSEEVERDLGAVKKLLAGEMNIYRIEKRYVNKQGQTIWVLLNTALLRDAKNQPLFFVTNIENIDEQKKLELTLQEKISELEKLNKLMIGRELGMIELKKEIAQLKNKN